ncbi:hypothetical protein D1631_05420 [Chryseobacterium nematophagum]|uniref:DUF3945 domain-containing protein n=1 Tax=Chryseobacterium nematophagum TaxID=2305228 RepID=A0A3M7TGR9_9FLAO|nr:hypothetical protein [Chryseobacterium nematophagum]RNA61410.1 hypothetical protein D1631_05420 [Chryseobacterium nematophagum]
MNNILPTDDLKKYGIIEADNSFSKKLSADDIQKFLLGYTIIADNDESRITFQLTDSSQLNVKLYERDKKLSEIIENSKNKIEYSEIRKLSERTKASVLFEKKAFVLNREKNVIEEYDIIKDATELTRIVAERKNTAETNRYHSELLKLKELLQQNIEKFPEIAKEITIDLNIVNKEINVVSKGFLEEQQISKEGKNVQFHVIDPSMYKVVNQQSAEEEQQEEADRSKGRGR